MVRSRLEIAVSLLVVLRNIHFSVGFSFEELQRSLKCPDPDVDFSTCELTLTVSHMLTLTAYNITMDTVSGYPMFVNDTGDLEFMYDPPGDINITLIPPIVADGFTHRNLIVVNNQLPGPTIIGYNNQKVRIRVINNLMTDAISLHWHGQHVNGSAYSDGVPYVTQCPIQPGNEFVYEFNFFPAGTYWYHSHLGDQRSNGLYGGMVVLPWPKSTSKEYEDLPDLHTLMFFEWFPLNSEIWIVENDVNGVGWPDPVNASKQYSSIKIADGTTSSTVPFYAGLIGGAGWLYTPDSTMCARRVNVKLPFYNIEQGKRYRFRLVGSQVTYAYRFSIHQHKLQLAATDGIDAGTPNDTLVDYIIVNVAERYDFILDGNQTIDNYLIVVETLEDPDIIKQRDYCIKAHRGYAVLHYSGASEQLPANFDDSYNPNTRCTETTCYAVNCPFKDYSSSYNISCINVDELQLIVKESVPNDGLNNDVFLNFGFNNLGATINSRKFILPESPILSQEDATPPSKFCHYSQDPDSPDFGKQCIHVYTTTTDTVELVYTNILGEMVAHPIHLHGHHFRVLKIGYPSYFENGTVDMPTKDITCGSKTNYNCNANVSWTNDTRPPTSLEDTLPQKDTITVPFGGYVIIRFPRDNWGWWIMHCHIEPHLLDGMAMLINETSAPPNQPVPPEFPQCGNYEATSSLIDPSVGQIDAVDQEANSFGIATILLGVICGILLLTLIIFVAILIFCICSKKGKCCKRSKPVAEGGGVVLSNM